jgi:SnoaL-like domain
LTFEEAADRLAIRELVNAYGHCADRRDCDGQMALFTENARFLIFMDAKAQTPRQTIIRRADLRPVFETFCNIKPRRTSKGKARSR